MHPSYDLSMLMMIYELKGLLNCGNISAHATWGAERSHKTTGDISLRIFLICLEQQTTPEGNANTPSQRSIQHKARDAIAMHDDVGL